MANLVEADRKIALPGGVARFPRRQPLEDVAGPLVERQNSASAARS
jgi:hypothetical protein